MLRLFFLTRFSRTRLSVLQWLLLSCALSCVMVLARVIATGYTTYLWLTWNLFLAYIPLAISYWLSARPSVIERRWKLAVTLFVWLLFVPNAFYIITDLFHLSEHRAAPRWFDLLLIFSFAWNGLLFGVMSVRRIELIINMAVGRDYSLLFTSSVMMLNAWGIYLGRYLRFNSWDLLTQPFTLLGAMLEMLFHPFDNVAAWDMIIFYGAFMTILYMTVRRLGEPGLATTYKLK